MSLSERIKEAVESSGKRPIDLAREAGVSHAAVSHWMRGATKTLKSDTAAALERATGYRATWLATGSGPKKSERPNVETGPEVRGFYPLISWVQAGSWTGICDNFEPGDAEKWLPCVHDLGENGYMLRVRGRSMENPGGKYSFTEGMILAVRAPAVPVPGQFAVARRQDTGEATFKRYVMLDGVPFLEAINPDWPKDLRYLRLQPGDVWCGLVVDAALGSLP